MAAAQGSQREDILAALWSFQQHPPRFTDVTIQLKEEPVRCSRILLAAMSPVFENMFSHDMSEARMCEVDMRHISKDTWTCIMEFYFSSKKLVSTENVAEVLQASHLYQLDRLTQHCSEFLLSICSPDNALAVQRTAAVYGLQNVRDKASSIIADNFSRFCKSEDFLCLERAELLDLLEKEELGTTEDDLCEALLKWVETKDADADTCVALLQHLKLRCLSDNFLENRVEDHEKFSKVPTLGPAVQAEICRRQQLQESSRIQAQPFRRRLLHSKNSLLVAGTDPYDRFCEYCWSVDEDKWITYSVTEERPEDIFSAAVAEDVLVVSGGIHMKSTHLFDLRTKSWRKGPDLLHDRWRHGTVVIGSTVYVVGGYGDSGLLASIEEYSQASGEWTHTGDLQVATSDGGVTALGDNFVVVGRSFPEENDWLIQTYHVETRTAAVLDVRLPRPMSYVQGASLGTTAFFVGSEGDLVQVRQAGETLQVEPFIKLKGFETGRTCFGLHVTGKSVLVLGGTRTTGVWYKTVECWSLYGERTEDLALEELPAHMKVLVTVEADNPLTSTAAV